MGTVRWRTPIKVLALRVVGATTGIVFIGITEKLLIILGLLFAAGEVDSGVLKPLALALERQAFLII